MKTMKSEIRSRAKYRAVILGLALAAAIGLEIFATDSLQAQSAPSSPAESPSSSQAASPDSRPALPRGKKLMLTDGSFQLVREYQVNGDRVRYYSLDSSQWEEIPASMIDWDATKKVAGEED